MNIFRLNSIRLEKSLISLLFVYVFFLCGEIILFNDVYASSSNVKNIQNKIEDNIYRYGPGVHVVDRIILTQPHSLIEGAGSGVTVLKIKNGIQALSANPIIRNLTIVGDNNGIGLHLMNTWSAKVQDVEIENFSIGIKLELSIKGREMAGGKTLNHWPGALTPDNWGSRVTLTEIRGVEIIGNGDGIILENNLKSDSSDRNYWKATDDKKPGEFINATTLWGGHIGVRGRALVIGNGVFKTKLIGTYIDISPAGGVIMEEGSRGLILVGVNLDLNADATRKNTPRISASKREAKMIQMYGTSPHHIDIKAHDNHK